MSVLLKKGSPYSRIYTSTAFPVLDANWSGSVSLYTTYPGTAVKTIPLVRVGNTMTLTMLTADIIALDAGVLSLVTTFINNTLGVNLDMLEYATVTDASVFTVPMCKLFITMGKMDATPAGKQTRTVSNNSVNGVSVVLGWEGLKVTATNALADNNGASIVDTESISTTTNAAGYAELYVKKGLTVNVTCPGFGKTLTVNTAGLDEKDLSTYFV